MHLQLAREPGRSALGGHVRVAWVLGDEVDERGRDGAVGDSTVLRPVLFMVMSGSSEGW